MEEPSDAVLSQLMREAAEDAKRTKREAAEDAKRTNDEATNRFFEQMRQDARKINVAW